MRHSISKKHTRIMAFLFIFCIMWQNISYAHAANETANNTILITRNGTVTEYPLEFTQIDYSSNLYDCTVTPVKIDDIWMIPAKNIFSEILGCYYKYSEEKQKIVIKSPGRETSISFTIDSNIAVVNGQEKTMPIEALPGTQKPSDSKDYMLPLAFTLEQLGYAYSVQDINTTENTMRHVIQIRSYYLFHKAEDNIEFDSNIYENALTGISIRKNESGTKNYIYGITMNPIPVESISINQSVKDYSVTMTFQKTYNPFGKVTELIENGIIQKIEIWETEDLSSCIRIYYNKEYIYSQKMIENGCMITISKGSFSMKVLLPDDVDFSTITTTDQYWNKRFLIIIPGNHIEFYKTYPPFSKSANITGIKVSITAEGNTKLTVTTKGLKGYRLTAGDGFFTAKVASPQSIYENIVLLDAGHGGKDYGASSKGLIEKKLNLNIIYTYAKQYFESPSSTVKAYWTRHDDTFINLYERPKLSEKYQADLFVSLHMNSASSSSANGTEVYYSKENNSKAFSGLNSKIFAQEMQNTLVDSLNNKSRGVKQAGFIVAKNNTVPAILIELGFVTGKTDAAKLKKTTYQKKAAKTLYEGIAATFKKYPTVR